MGLGVVLIFYAIAMTIAATVGAIVLGAINYFLTRQFWPKSKYAVIASVVFPYVCVGFAGVWFISYAVINSTVFHRDPGLGDSWETPLPNGYALMMIDTTDQGTVYNPKTQPRHGSVTNREDTAFGARQLQISNDLIFGASDSGYFGRIGQESKVVDTFFELNTAKKIRIEFKTLEELRQRAASEGVTLNLRDFYTVFHDYRTTWFDYLALAVLLLIPFTGFLLLARWIWRLRQPNASSEASG
jgi:energy-coupling factor transporter transmembrane protein EcfT